MGSNAFYPNLNEFCRKYLVVDQKISPDEASKFDARWRKTEAEIFENLLLFDKVTFKVFGENIPFALLLNLIGQNGLEELAEQGAIGFTLWTPGVVFLQKNIEGIDSIASITHNSPAHSDPETSLELAFGWMRNKPKRATRRALIRKFRDLYELPDKNLPADMVSFVKSAFFSGRLAKFGFDPTTQALDTLNTEDKKAMTACASELLEYSYLLARGMTSISKGTYYDFFTESQKRISLAEKQITAFIEIAKIENFPDLQALHEKISNPYDKLIKLRRTSASTVFRSWLFDNANNAQDISEITTAYISAIAEPNGFFQTWKGKIVKSIISSSIGAGAGGLAAGSLGALFGAVAAHAVEPACEPIIDLLDDYLLDGLTKGWTPRLFVDQLRKF